MTQHSRSTEETPTFQSIETLLDQPPEVKLQLLQRAYREPAYEAAKERLAGLHADLQQINGKAARSLEEGVEDTLTLHRLGLFEELGRNLKITNGIENLMGQVSRRIKTVRRWHHSPQRHQWMALAVLETESRMRRITGYDHLPKLMGALKEEIANREWLPERAPSPRFN